MKRFLPARLLCLIMALALLPFALAEGTAVPTPGPTPVPIGEYGLQYGLYETDGEHNLFNMKSILNDHHYYPSGTPDDAIKSDYFERYTLQALKRCCDANNLEYSEYGVTTETYFAIVQGRILDASATLPPEQTPVEQAYPPLYPNVTDGPEAHVSQLQLQLQKLGYNKSESGEPLEIRPGVFDLNTLAMIRLFCEFNGIRVPEQDPGIVDSSTQEAIMKSEVRYVEPEEVAEIEEGESGLRGYFLKEVSLLGIKTVCWVVWLIALALVVALVVVILYFFVPGAKKKEAAGKGSIQFVIEYKGKKKDYHCDIDHTLKIGRGVGDFPIDVSDLSISRKHCEIYYSGKTLMIRDYSSTGTFVNGKNCSKGEYALHTNDTIKIGDHVLTIVF